jgi:hypothetical protein
MFICWLRVFALVRVTIFSVCLFQHLCDSTIPWNSVVLSGYFLYSASNTYFMCTVVQFPLEEKCFTNSIPKKITGITLQKAWGNKASGSSCGKRRSLCCILPTQIHHCKVSSIWGTLKAAISLHSVQHNLPLTTCHQQGLTVTVDVWLVFKFEQIRTNQIFHNWIYWGGRVLRLCVLVDLSCLVHGRCREKIAYWACWSTLLSDLFMMRESTKLRGIIT